MIIYKIIDFTTYKVVYQNKFKDFKGFILDVTISDDNGYLWVSNSIGYVFTISLKETPFSLINSFQSDGGVKVNTVV